MNNTPLAERMRPKKLDSYVGQTKLLGPKGTLKNIIKSGLIPSMILWGPPGTGKTTLAELLSKIQKRPFYQISAINAGVKDIREIIEKSKNRGELFTKQNPILFIDEIHRFNKSQQDALLGAVEKGTITLIGATTENPSFEVINALLSRCQVFILEPLPVESLREIISKAISEDAILSKKNITIKEDEALLRLSGGDARKLLSILELVISVLDNSKAIKISNDTAYGLTNYIQTNDTKKAQRIARQLRSGMVEINGVSFADGSPFGGYKQSGNGREGGKWGIEEFLEVKSISGWK